MTTIAPFITIVNDTYSQLANWKVFACRIGVHSLKAQGGQISENHLTIYLLVGSGHSVRVDMTPGDSLNTGHIKLSGLDYAISCNVIRFVDIPARNSTSDFDAETTALQQSSNQDVSTFVRSITKRNLQYFRFLYVNDHSNGCRHWM